MRESTNFNIKDKIAVLAKSFPASPVSSNLDIYILFFPICHVILGTPLCLRGGVQDPFHARKNYCMFGTLVLENWTTKVPCIGVCKPDHGPQVVGSGNFCSDM